MTREELAQVLSTVEQDHELIASQMRLLRQITRTVLDAEGPNYDEALEHLHEIERFIATKLLPHCRAEETELFPVFAERLPGGRRLVDELLAEHAELRFEHEQFRAALALLNYLDDSRYPVLLNLCSMSWRMADMLARHAEKERQAMNECVKRVLAANGAVLAKASAPEEPARCS